MKIGFFDSGLGGLFILKAVIEELPEYDYVYYGDTKHVPYGDRSEGEIYQLTKQGVEYLFAHDCQVVILACNTASSETLRRLQDEYLPKTYPGRRILGVIIPVIEELIESDCEHVKLIATERTVHSGKYHLELGKRGVIGTTIEAIAVPGLVPLIESQNIDDATKLALTAICDKQRSTVGEVDGVILGCTHYTLLKDRLRTELGTTIRVFSQDEIIPQKIKMYLEVHQEIKEQLTCGGSRDIYLTEEKRPYEAIIEELLGHSRS